MTTNLPIYVVLLIQKIVGFFFENGRGHILTIILTALFNINPPKKLSFLKRAQTRYRNI